MHASPTARQSQRPREPTLGTGPAPREAGGLRPHPGAPPPGPTAPPIRTRRCALMDEVPGLGPELAPRSPAQPRAGSPPLPSSCSRPAPAPAGVVRLDAARSRAARRARRTGPRGPRGRSHRDRAAGPRRPAAPVGRRRRRRPVRGHVAGAVAADVALLDAFYADRIRAWPALGDDLVSRADARARSLAMLRAIAAHPRVDMRVAMVLWHLASRWGRVQAGRDGPAGAAAHPPPRRRAGRGRAPVGVARRRPSLAARPRAPRGRWLAPRRVARRSRRGGHAPAPRALTPVVIQRTSRLVRKRTGE